MLPVGGRILSEPLFEERFVCIVRREHPLVQGELDLKMFLSLSHLLVSPENERYGRVDEALARRDLKRRLGLTLPQMYAAPAVVARSDFIATVMAGVVEASRCGPELQILAPPLALEPASFVMSWHQRNDGHRAQRWLRRHLATIVAPRMA